MPDRKVTDTTEFVTFTREALFQMLGEVALPPAWGPDIGADLDCAVLAENLVTKVEEYRFA